MKRVGYLGRYTIIEGSNKENTLKGNEILLKYNSENKIVLQHKINNELVTISSSGDSPEPSQPNNEIWYTSTDGNMVDLYYNGKCYGDEECTQELTILDHTYENGKGIIKFNSSIVSCGHIEEDNGLFEESENLLTCTLPDSCKIVGLLNFYRCINLSNINSILSNSITHIGGNAFEGVLAIEEVCIPKNVVYIDDSIFVGCHNLTLIGVSEENEIYDSRNNCNAIVETSTNTLIQGCQSTVIPNSVTNIGDSAFYACTGLTSITIPDSVTTIGKQAFYGCSGLTSVTCLAATPPTGGSDMFKDTNNCPIYVPADSVALYKDAINWKSYADRIYRIPGVDIPTICEILYCDNAFGDEIRPHTDMPGIVGESVTVSALPVDGYTLFSASPVTIVLRTQNNKVTFYYDIVE